MTDFFFDPEIFDEADRIYAEIGEVRRRATVTPIPVVDRRKFPPRRTAIKGEFVEPINTARVDDGREVW